MFQQQNQQQNQPVKTDALGFVYTAASSLSACVTPFIRSGFGVEYPGMYGLFGLLIIIAYAAFAPAPRMVLYLWVWLFALVVQRTRSIRLDRKGRVEHSRYPGWPWLAMKVPFVRSEMLAKGLVEPMICMVGGALLCPLDVGIGVFLILCSFGLTTARSMEVGVARMRARRMRDAYIEQCAAVEEFRNVGGRF